VAATAVEPAVAAIAAAEISAALTAAAAEKISRTAICGHR